MTVEKTTANGFSCINTSQAHASNDKSQTKRCVILFFSLIVALVVSSDSGASIVRTLNIVYIIVDGNELEPMN